MRLVVRTLSELCITVGALIVLFVCYVLFWTGVRADRAMDGEIDRLEDRWATGPVSMADPPPGARTVPPPRPPLPAGPRRRRRPRRPTGTAGPSR